MTNQLKEELKKEALRLKKLATKEELNKLDFRNLNPMLPQTCIYGQLSGDCFNDRAKELFDLTATPFSGGLEEFCSPFSKSFCEEDKLRKSFSAIEYYIYQEDSDPQKLIDYLQDKTQVLDI